MGSQYFPMVVGSEVWYLHVEVRMRVDGGLTGEKVPLISGFVVL